jgi:hypothetical protein
MTELVNVFSNDIRKKVKYEVPNIAGAWVEFYDDLLGEHQKLLTEKQEDKDAGFIIAQLMISDWNLADKDSKKLDITVENIKRLPFKVQIWLANTSSNILLSVREEKKELAGS